MARLISDMVISDTVVTDSVIPDSVITDAVITDMVISDFGPSSWLGTEGSDLQRTDSESYEANTVIE
jgi:hypothetical protein